MCGIVGFTGNRQAAPILLDGLSKLEYRGYDSAGIAVFEKGEISVCKAKGELKKLTEKMKKEHKPYGHCGIGHTRWATHGEPSDINSHPHGNKRVSIVHNGIIENYKEIKDFLIDKGYTFVSETDTETVAKLLDYYYEGDPIDAIIKTLKDVTGAYALGIIFKDFPDTIYAVRKDSPLIIGKGEEENFIASDVPAILKYTRNYYLLEYGEIATIKSDRIEFCDFHKQNIKKEIQVSELDMDAAEKGGYEHFMLKEIHEQPTAVNTTIAPRIVNGMPDLSECGLTPEKLKSYHKLFIVACGTAMHAGMVGKYVIEKLARTEVTVDIASEFRYRDPIVDEKTLCIFISQSGETADTIAALKLSKEKGAKTLAISNVIGSSITREADYSIYTHAGPEIAVASTKAYTSQVVLLAILAIYFAETLELTDKNILELKNNILELPSKIEETLKCAEQIKEFGHRIYQEKDVFFLGRGIDETVAKESALKLKEISYIHADSYPAGELKHGPIALIENDITVISIMTDKNLVEKTVSNIQEVITRGAKTLVVTNQNIDDKMFDTVIHIPETNTFISPILSVIPLQLLAYYISKEKGLDVDKPRNLAKSVTVE